jgi:MFS family permease
MRSLFLLVAAVILVDTMFFAAVAPLLPEYADDLELSKTGAGILTGSYAAGAFLGSLPGGWLTARLGAKPAVLLGLMLVALACLAFGFGTSVVVLDVARFIQGTGGAWMWAGGMAWLISASTAERRGGLIGAALSAAVVGLLLGPVLGGLATVAGSEAVFGFTGGVCLLLALWAASMSGIPKEGGLTMGATIAALRQPAMVAGIWLLTLPALLSGVIQVLAPLRLNDLGATGVAVGAVFLITAGVEAVLSPFVGRLSDTRGRLTPIRIGLVCATAGALVAPLPDTAVLVAVVVLFVYVALAGLWTPAMALISDAAERSRVEQGYAFAIINMAWALGQLVGSGAGGALADAAGDDLPYAAMAALCGATFVGAVVFGRRESYVQAA